MALSVGRMSAASTTSYEQIRPQNYSVTNQSAVSSVYEESVQQAGALVGGAQPVQYPNAQIAEQAVSHVQASQKMEQAYNAIASAFEGTTTSYQGDMQGSGYAMIGSQIDVYA